MSKEALELAGEIEYCAREKINPCLTEGNYRTIVTALRASAATDNAALIAAIPAMVSVLEGLLVDNDGDEGDDACELSTSGSSARPRGPCQAHGRAISR